MKVRAYYWHHGVMPKWKIKIRDVVRRDGFKYFETGNAGDILNRNIIESKYNASPVNISQEGRRLLMIGSVSHRVKDGDVICGVGTQGKADDIEKKSDVKIFGLRGPITYDEFKEKGYDVSNVSFLMDPGLLVRFMYSDESIQPEKGKVIFIPHYKERRYYRKIEGKGNMKMVDIDASPEDICREILSAEHVFSSSLHGIVFSHALERPITFVQPIHESLLKFKDYYSSIGIDLPKPLEGFEGKFMSGVGLSPVTLNYMEEDFLMPGPEYLKSAGVMVR